MAWPTRCSIHSHSKCFPLFHVFVSYVFVQLIVLNTVIDVLQALLWRVSHISWDRHNVLVEFPVKP